MTAKEKVAIEQAKKAIVTYTEEGKEFPSSQSSLDLFMAEKEEHFDRADFKPFCKTLLRRAKGI